MNNTRRQKPEEADSNGEPSKNGFRHRLRDGGRYRIVHGSDLHLSLGILVAVAVIYYRVNPEIVTPSLVSTGTPLAISLVAFILASVSLLISFSDERFLKLLNDLDIYNNILFSFEYTLYLSLITSIVGIATQAYQDLLVDTGTYAIVFFLFVFLFFYMVFSVGALVSLVISIGKRKAMYLSKIN